MDKRFMLLPRACTVAICFIMWTMPMVLEFRRTFLEDLPTSLRTEHVITKTEILVQHESTLRYPLAAILTLDVSFVRRFFRPFVFAIFHLLVRMRMVRTQSKLPWS